MRVRLVPILALMSLAGALAGCSWVGAGSAKSPAMSPSATVDAIAIACVEIQRILDEANEAEKSAAEASRARKEALIQQAQSAETSKDWRIRAGAAVPRMEANSINPDAVGNEAALAIYDQQFARLWPQVPDEDLRGVLRDLSVRTNAAANFEALLGFCPDLK